MSKDKEVVKGAFEAVQALSNSIKSHLNPHLKLILAPVSTEFSYTVKPRFTAPRFTAAYFFPQIGFSMHIVNKRNPDLPRTPIYRGCFLYPKTRSKSGFCCIGRI